MQEKSSSPIPTSPTVDDPVAVLEPIDESTLSKKKSRKFFTGPLPHPDTLEQYEKILPGIAERIVKMAEAEQKARHSAIEQDGRNKTALVEIANKESKGALEAQKKGQNIGLFITCACVVCSVICALLDKPVVVTCAFLAVPTASYIGSFMPKLLRKE